MVQQSNTLNANVLVIGRSGVGKSSLLNYLFGREIEKTGAGRPVTEKGIFPHTYQYNNQFTIQLYDTWGLEAGKVNEWKKIILDKVQEHDKKAISEWFHTIIFCTSLDGDRFLPFEINTVKALMKEHNNVIIAITHCKTPNDSEAIQYRDNQICEKTGISPENVVFVSSVQKKLIGGKETSQFGKEEIFRQVIRNLWSTFKNKLPVVVRMKLKAHISRGTRKLLDEVDNHNFIFQRREQIEQFEQDINSKFSKIVKRLAADVDAQFNDAYTYYSALSKHYGHIGGVHLDLDAIHKQLSAYNATKGFEKDVGGTVNALGDKLGKVFHFLNQEVTREVLKEFGVALKTYFTSVKKIKTELRTTIQKYMDEAHETIQGEIKRIEGEIQKLDIDSICL